MTDQGNPQSNRPIRGQSMHVYGFAGAILAGLAIAITPFDFFLSAPENLESVHGDVERFIKLSELFAHGFGVAIIAIGIWLLAPSKQRLIPRIVMCAMWPAAGVQLVKILVGRFRPVKYFDEHSTANFPSAISDTWMGWLPDDRFNLTYASQSFPSGHTATTWGLAIGMCWAFPKGKWLFFGVAILASVQRVTSFAHWPSDVFFGAAVAFIMAGGITQNWGFGYFFNKFENRNASVDEMKSAFTEELQTRKAA